MKERLIEMTRAEYTRMVQKCDRYDTLVSALMDDATLRWRPGLLALSAESASIVLKHIEQLNYRFKLNELELKKKQEEEK